MWNLQKLGRSNLRVFTVDLSVLVQVQHAFAVFSELNVGDLNVSLVQERLETDESSSEDGCRDFSCLLERYSPLQQPLMKP